MKEISDAMIAWIEEQQWEEWEEILYDESHWIPIGEQEYHQPL